VRAYIANLTAKSGKLLTRVQYRVSGGAWTSRNFIRMAAADTADCLSFAIATDNNIGLVKADRITALKIVTIPRSTGLTTAEGYVPYGLAARKLVCDFVERECSGQHGQ
jgi:hypothetical protein